MQVYTLGEGTPEVAVVGAIHGDEPCGARAIERFLDEDPDVDRPAKLIVANERALERGVRYVDTDLNRCLPGDPESDQYEERLAHELMAEVRGCTALGIHSTVSYARPFANVACLDGRERGIVAHLPVEQVVDFTVVADGRSAELPGFVDIEAGHQGSAAAADNAYDCLVAFLQVTGVLPGDPPDPNPEFYEVTEPIYKEPGRTYHFRGENFERVAPGDRFADVDGDSLVADEEFWPVLMSDDGHDVLFGYRSTYHGPLSSLPPLDRTEATAESADEATDD
ncbi:succinylglutamate desuccinylase/aspartoacylase domain-containing protein [Haloplanus pelagicus]|jgi:predicted deacylase|uniref:succinylglutamate desuccinylase/aspartoacylase domain-containing protein n=1 Tax=Haloplanus pelagicus TaxID=2949995 RepID=UPI00204051E6|nr:succinylglutamate desuccinylase/aspartoacylase family protein [Haloplanus sp. HW8-1]